jgi:hypothetical protein
MRKLLAILAFTGIAGLAKAETVVNADAYKLDEAAIVNTIDAAQDVTVSLATEPLQPAASLSADGTFKTVQQNAFYQAAGGKSAVAAILLNFFLGGLGIHRFYLGTKVLTGIGYILTCGGIFGVVPLVDFIVLIVHASDISEYEDNPKFFMWG